MKVARISKQFKRKTYFYLDGGLTEVDYIALCNQVQKATKTKLVSYGRKWGKGHSFFFICDCDRVGISDEQIRQGINQVIKDF